MKDLIVLFIFLMSMNVSAQTSESNLNGMVFRGTATEQTPPDIDRMPIIYDELIRFENGKINSEVLKVYGANDSKYSSELDNRRMIALKVVNFESSSAGSVDGTDVNIEFSGSIFADLKLSGDLVITYPDKSEVKFLINASLE